MQAGVLRRRTGSRAIALRAAVTIAVAPVNDVPLAMDQTFAMLKNVPVATPLQATDVEGNVLNYLITVPPVHGTVSGSAPAMTWTPEPNCNGTDSSA